nr:Fur family transcriptional regulator [Aurantimonas sp. VKM B-3413]
MTRNQGLVFAALERADAPLSAYTILDRLRGEGLKAPLQVYRALDKLVAYGMVHRLESLNAFVPCRQDDCDAHETAAFMICETCGKVAEFADETLTERLEAVTRASGFTLHRTTIELRGICAACGAAQ